MDDHKNLIEWKTNFWRDDRVADVYHKIMLGQSGVTPLKNEIEVDLCRSHVTGQTLLDVGAGTGRGSLPLAREGYRVTALDSSAAMLAHYRRQAEGLPIEFHVGDAVRLPFADAAFDSLIALNTMVHFPHWREVLGEWSRVVKPGGRLVFDLCSQDHFDAAEGLLDLSPLAQSHHESCVSHATGEVVGSDYMAYLNRVRVADLVQAADAGGLRVVAVVPYGILISGVDYNLWRLSTLAEGSGWERLLSWLGEDRRLSEFAVFLEREVIGRLTSRVTGRYVAVLEKTPDSVGNAAWLARDVELNARLAGPVAWPDMQALVADWDADWKARLNIFLDWPRNRTLFYFLWTGFWDFPEVLDLASLLEPRHLEALEKWRRNWMLDQATTRTLRAFVQAPAFAETFEWQGVNLRCGLEYELTRNVLTDYFKAFEQ